MNYVYQKRSCEELEHVAEIVLNRYASRRNGSFVDIEAIIEDCEITVLPRPGLRKLVNGYTPKDPRFIVIEESYGTYAPQYRRILGEEFCHILLEYDLLSIGTIPANAQAHTLTFEQYKEIEHDAQFLARAILLPRDTFQAEWKKCFDAAPPEQRTVFGEHLIFCAENLENVFKSWPLQIAYRARDLNLMTDIECRKFFSDHVAM